MTTEGFRPFSAQEYFSFLLEKAAQAAARGNYAISAAAVVRCGNYELIAFGTNTVFAGRSAIGHAEINAIRRLHAVARSARALTHGRKNGSMIVRPRRDGREESVLYTTLEPCPMCTVCIINAGIDRVVIAAEDPPSGSLARKRLAALPPLWPKLAARLQVVWAQSKHPKEADTFVSRELRDALLELFDNSRTALDVKLGQRGTLNIAAIRERLSAAAIEESSQKSRSSAREQMSDDPGSRG